MRAELGSITTPEGTEANANVTHADFVSGVKSRTMGFAMVSGEPYRLTRGFGRFIFNLFSLLYQLGPLLLVPAWAFHTHNAWLLFGILFSYAGTFTASMHWKLIPFVTVYYVASCFRSGFHPETYFSFFFFSALFGFLCFKLADDFQNTYAMKALLDDPNLFEHAVTNKHIMILRKN